MGAQTWASLGEVVGKRCILKVELAGVVDVFFSKPSSGFPFHLAQKSKPKRGPWGPLMWPRLPRLPPLQPLLRTDQARVPPSAFGFPRISGKAETHTVCSLRVLLQCHFVGESCLRGPVRPPSLLPFPGSLLLAALTAV